MILKQVGSPLYYGTAGTDKIWFVRPALSDKLFGQFNYCV